MLWISRALYKSKGLQRRLAAELERLLAVISLRLQETGSSDTR